jgi:pimeloyl-ACP methyl ester carboxylesterase
LAGCATGSPETSATTSRGSAATGGLTDSPTAPLSLFASSLFNDEALFVLGGASSHTAEVGEVLRIAQGIGKASGNPANPETDAFDAYYDGFGAYGDDLDRIAGESGGVTARNRYLRTSSYAAQQLFFVLGTGRGDREEAIFETCSRRWVAAIDLFQPEVQRFEVKSEFGPLPGYFFPAPSGADGAPTVIISEGSDGQNVETMQFGVTAGLERGYNVVLFEGPGQMGLLFKRGIPFTADWQKVVGPVLEWTRALPEVGKVALVGISFGGMLCARAAAELDGLDAVVLEPGAHDFPSLWQDQKTMGTVKETQKAPAAEKEKVAKQVNEGFAQAWPGLSRTDQFTIYKRGEIFTRQAQVDARAGKPVSDYYGLLEAMLPFSYERDFRSISIPTMITANEGDEFFGDQPEKAFDMLEKVPASRKHLQKLTGRQGAALHDQPTGPQVAEEFVFDWLDEQLR